MTARTRIKVCGITNNSDAAVAVTAGVDALGFIFVASSPRNIEPGKARDIVAALPPFVDAVGVFMDAPVEVVEEISQYCGLTVVQLHGAESPEYCESLSGRVLKTFRVMPDSLNATGVNGPYGEYFGVVEGFLLDTYHEKLGGGTGKTFDWKIVEKVRPPGPVILAGGLNPDNVGEAIQVVRPFAVDVSSGVELEPGIKDVSKIERLVDEVRRADGRVSAIGQP